MSGAEVHADVKHDDDEDEDDVGHEPDIDLLEVAGLWQVGLDGGEERGEDEEGGQRAHEPVGEHGGPATLMNVVPVQKGYSGVGGKGRRWGRKSRITLISLLLYCIY